MEQWQDQGIVLAVRPHGESGAIVSLLTEQNGRHAGYVRGAHSSKNRGSLEVGSLVDARWSSRVSEGLGSLTIELSQSYAPRIMQDATRLAALQSACALCDASLPEREGHPGLFHGFIALLETLEGEHWAAAYVMWEISLLREMGFSLDLTKCAGGGDSGSLCYVSPKTGRAVSREHGALYKDRLLKLPAFLRPLTARPEEKLSYEEDILSGLNLTGHFLEHWAFTHHAQGIPEARLRFYARFAKYVSDLIPEQAQKLHG